MINKLNADLSIIQKLEDEPNDVGGLTSGELKLKFDEGGLTIQDFINNSLIKDLENEGILEILRTADPKMRFARLNSDGAMEVSPNGVIWTVLLSSGHIVVDEQGRRFPQRSQLTFANSQISDDGVTTVVRGVTGDKGETGEKGKSAYESALEGGYAGTEGEFNAELAKLPQKADLAVPMTSGNLAGLNASGNITDSGKNAADFAASADFASAFPGGSLAITQGTWTPVMNWGTTSATSWGRWTKTGNLVTAAFYVHCTDAVTVESGYKISGLPYASAVPAGGCAVFSGVILALNGSTPNGIDCSNTTVYVRVYNYGTLLSATAPGITTYSTIYGSITYRTN